jgi:hypothetical protein
MNKWMILLAIPMLMSGAGCGKKASSASGNAAEQRFIQQVTVDKVITSLAGKYGDAEKSRIQRGVAQAATLWRDSDGKAEDFEKFCTQNFVAGDTAVNMLFTKLSYAIEVLNGNFNKMGLDLRVPLDLVGGEVTPIDEMLGAYSPSAHLTDDLFQNKVAFVTILNFPFYSLKEKTDQGMAWSRRQWAYARMGDMFTSRVPAELLLKISASLSSADSYISGYNIMMGNLVDKNGKSFFPADMKLITHWGLRDELKSDYAIPNGLTKQKMIYAVMKRIIDQSIPQEVINNAAVKWNVEDNKVIKDGKAVASVPEPDTRYQHLLNNFNAEKAVDPYYPGYPTFMNRSFELGMEIPQEDVEKLFIDFITSPQVKEVAALISKRLGRHLEPFDIWYDGFKARSTISEDMLTGKTSKLYPNPAAFQKDMPNILVKLGWTPDRAAFIASKVQVDPARGSGHAAGAAMKSDKARLRTRIADNGMNYKGYNIAVHEFGHNVEQTMTLQNVDYYMLNGVPNTSFTEALAFIFQKRDLELLGIKDNNPEKEDLMALDNFWMSYEIMGVSLVDMNVWKWMYAHPDATAAQLKEAVITIAKETWNKYYAPVFGSKDEPILAIYSHMIDNPLYLSNYPVGHLIDFQIEKQITGKPFAKEVERIYEQGRLIPQVWMKGAVGREISTEPILEATSHALKVVK